MTKNNANVIIHIRVPGHLDDSRKSGIEHTLRGEPGVTAVKFAKKKFIRVDYNPAIVKSRRLLDSLSGQGLTASLIGM